MTDGEVKHSEARSEEHGEVVATDSDIDVVPSDNIVGSLAQAAAAAAPLQTELLHFLSVFIALVVLIDDGLNHCDLSSALRTFSIVHTLPS